MIFIRALKRIFRSGKLRTRSFHFKNELDATQKSYRLPAAHSKVFSGKTDPLAQLC